jgi:hypothetical protein
MWNFRHPSRRPTSMRAVRKLFQLFQISALVIVAFLQQSSPAEAHSAANSPASNYRTKLLKVTPSSEAYQARVIETGNRFELRWKSGAELTVPDYDDHPYLRIGPKGVEENQQSNAKYLNSSRLGSTNIPDGLKPEGPPAMEAHLHRARRPLARSPDSPDDCGTSRTRNQRAKQDPHHRYLAS